MSFLKFSTNVSVFGDQWHPLIVNSPEEYNRSIEMMQYPGIDGCHGVEAYIGGSTNNDSDFIFYYQSPASYIPNNSGKVSRTLI